MDIAISDIDLGKNSCSPAGLETLDVVLRRWMRRRSFRNLPKDWGVALRRWSPIVSLTIWATFFRAGTRRRHLDQHLLRRCRLFSRSQSNDGCGAHSGRCRGDSCKGAIRPNATYTVAIRNVRFTSIRDMLKRLKRANSGHLHSESLGACRTKERSAPKAFAS
jgi:hypothetical protein